MAEAKTGVGTCSARQRVGSAGEVMAEESARTKVPGGWELVLEKSGGQKCRGDGE